MFALQLGRTRVAWLLLVTSASSALVFAWLAATLRDWLAAGVALGCFTVAVRMGVLVRRRSGLRNIGVIVPPRRGDRSAAMPSGLFMTQGFHAVGARFRHGVIVVGHGGAAFLPTSGWNHLAWELLTSPLVARFRFVDLIVDLPAGADMNAALHETAEKHGGFFIDDGWTWTPSQRWLTRPDFEGVVSLSSRPPPDFAARWAPGASPSAATLRYVFRRVATVGVSAAAVLVISGYVAWKSTGDVDYLVAGISYAAIVIIAVVVGLVAASRALGRPRGSAPDGSR